jgi:hypothetical protein
MPGWIPFRVRAGLEPGVASTRVSAGAVDWCFLGDDAFTAPFFAQTIERCWRKPFNQLFAHETPIAALRPLGGRAFHSPRFFADTMRLLVSHDDPLGDGAYRPDLYEWNYRSGRLRRITRGSGIREADPLPDGRAAVGVRCENGLCDLVRVDLATGAVVVLRRSTPSTPFRRPRVSPDGRSAVVAAKHDGRWRLALGIFILVFQ